jgi:Fe-S cluster assembly protein SufD
MSDLSTQLADSLPHAFTDAPGWLQSLRERGAEQFRAHGLPTPRDEAWKYTRLGKLDKAGLKLALQTEAEAPGFAHAAPLVPAALQVNMLDGRLHSQAGDAVAGLTVLSLADALQGQTAALKGLLESLQETVPQGRSADGFTALNTATLDAGLFIHVAAGHDGGRLLLNWSSRGGEAPLLSNSRVCVILEKGARLGLLEQFENPQGNDNNTNVVLQMDLQESAGLQHVRFQHESDAAVVITRTEVAQQANSEYAYYGFDLGGGLVRHDLHTSIVGRGAKSMLSGAYLLDGNRHVDNHARVDHKAPGGYSEQYFRGVAGGSGRAVFNTAVCVHPGADETEALQSNGNILLSARAEVDTKPELEIYADEVVASHGATVGQLDEQAVFYLRSRGLTEEAARHLLTAAFCNSVSDKLADRVLGDVISERMKQVMPQAG